MWVETCCRCSKDQEMTFENSTAMYLPPENWQTFLSTVTEDCFLPKAKLGKSCLCWCLLIILNKQGIVSEQTYAAAFFFQCCEYLQWKKEKKKRWDILTWQSSKNRAVKLKDGWILCSSFSFRIMVLCMLTHCSIITIVNVISNISVFPFHIILFQLKYVYVCVSEHFANKTTTIMSWVGNICVNWSFNFSRNWIYHVLFHFHLQYPSYFIEYLDFWFFVVVVVMVWHGRIM